jgi:NhaA family Na+:H+ antiporter
MLGITLTVALVVRLGMCGLPERTTWRHIVGVSLLCGMGITVPLLFAHAVFGGASVLFSGAQIGLVIGTVGSAVLGAAVLLAPRRPPRPMPEVAAAVAARATVPSASGVGSAPPATFERKEGRPACEPD